MTIANLNDPGAMVGAPVHGRDNAKLGKVHAIYYDNDTNKPEWAAVKGGMFGGQVSLVPLTQANWDGSALTVHSTGTCSRPEAQNAAAHRGAGADHVDNATGRPTWAAVQDRRHSAMVPLENSRFDGASLHVPFDAEQLQSAPHHDPSTLISYAEGDDLARHYGLLPTPPAPSDPGRPTAPGDVAPTEGAGAEEPDAGASGSERSGEVEDGVMTRSAEQLRAATVNVVVGRARLVKYIVTDQMTYTVPVSREEVRIEYDPLPTHEQTINDTGPA